MLARPPSSRGRKERRTDADALVSNYSSELHSHHALDEDKRPGMVDSRQLHQHACASGVVASVVAIGNDNRNASSSHILANDCEDRITNYASDRQIGQQDMLHAHSATLLPTTIKKRRRRKYQKSTHTLRKEERRELVKQLNALQTQLDALRMQTLAPTGIFGGAYTTRVALLDAIQRQQLQFADIQAVVSEYASTQSVSSIHSYIHLGKDKASRHHMLVALKDKKIQAAEEFILRRCNGLDPFKPFTDSQNYETPEGDYWATQLKVTQFAGAESVQQVFNLLLSYFGNIEISLSEKLGNITIREDDDNHGQGVTQNRLVTSTKSGVLMETNTVMFAKYSEFDQAANGGECGLMIADFIDQDDLHPYRPKERIRRDISGVCRLTSYKRKVNRSHEESDNENTQKGNGGEEEELVVVMFRWATWMFHHPHFPIVAADWKEVLGFKDLWWDALFKSVTEQLPQRDPAQ